ncbi:MAG: PBP1A family penicillin-binding protein [Gemmatimonadetes bacterium]|nr:PBP1A family penicillin-binding protein [Gemmatimonadota bacterium]
MRDTTAKRHELAAWLIQRLWYPRVYLIVGTFFVAAAVGGFWGTWKNLCAGDACPSIAQVKTWQPEQTSKLFSADGQLIGELGFERRTPVSIHAIPAYVPEAVVSIEDKRFYKHGGFDPLGIARAVVGKLSGHYMGGGSTITQQLARNIYDQQLPASVRTGWAGYVRKLKEVQVALELERAYTKDQILEAYINQIYMGRAGYGFQSAARYYLGKNLADVNPAEAALLAAILNVPAVYDPFVHPENALRRRNLVLTKMAQQGYLTKAEAAHWKEEPLPTQEQSPEAGTKAPYFVEWVRQILDSRFGDEIYRNGLRVYTTLNVKMQAAAEAAMKKGWAAIEADPNFDHPKYADFDTVKSFPGGTPYLQGAFIALDPATGQVKALIGGRNFDQSKFDRVRLAQRQAGSSFKPFVYTAAIASGIPASHIIIDGPVVLPQVSGQDWRPANFENEFKGPMTLREGLYTSTNMIAIKLGWNEVGIQTVIQTARHMGIQTPLRPYPSTTIGAAEVIPLQMAEAYSAFPTLGTKVRPFPILRVEDRDGHVLWEPQPERTQVLDSLVSRIMVSMMQDVITQPKGTGHYAVRVLDGLPDAVPAAGKTGTTNDGTNVWFDGFTPNLLAVVWFGMDNPVPIFKLGKGRRQATGGGLAAPVWGDFMKQVYYGSAATVGPESTDTTGVLPIPSPWPIPSGLDAVLVDRKTGKLASRWCPTEDQYVEYYLPGTEPTEFCDRSSGRIRIPR